MTDPTDNSNSHKRASSKIISIESTADGDIQTVEETTFANNNNTNDSVKAFTHHLRDSWDDGQNKGSNNNANGNNHHHRDSSFSVTSTSRHKQNLSVQFLDFSISDGADGGAGDDDKETIENTAAYYFDGAATPSIEDNALAGASLEGAADAALKGSKSTSDGSNAAANEDKMNFANNIRSSWGAGNATTASSEAESSTSSHHKLTPSVQFLDSEVLEYAEDLPAASSLAPNSNNERKDDATAAGGDGNNNDYTSFTNNIRNSWGSCFLNSTIKESSGQGEESSPGSSASGHKLNPSVQFLDSTIMEYSTAEEDYNLNDSPGSNFSDGNNNEYGREKADQKDDGGVAAARAFEPPPSKTSPRERNSNDMLAPSQPRLGNDSPLSPSTMSEKNDIVVPIPLRPAAMQAGAATGGVSRKHRRVFSGRSNPAMVHRRVNTRGDKCAPTKEFKFEGLESGRRGSGNDNDDEGGEGERFGKKKMMFAGPAYEQRLSPDTSAMPPPVPDRLVQQGQGQPPPPGQYPGYYQGTTPPPTYDPYNNAGQQPSHGAYYNASPKSDAGVNYSGTYQSQGYPPNQQPPPHQQQPGYPQSAPPNNAGRGYDAGRYNNPTPPPPQHLAQPTLDEEHPLSPRSQRVDENMFARDNTNKGQDKSHRKEPSFNPLPYKDDPANSHHRKQSSLGSFLATTSLFDEDMFYEDNEGYVSAPEEGETDKHKHNKTLSSASFCRSLSSDNFLTTLNNTEQDQQQSQSQQAQRRNSGSSGARRGFSFMIQGSSRDANNNGARAGGMPPPLQLPQQKYREPPSHMSSNTSSEGGYMQQSPTPPPGTGYPPAQPTPPQAGGYPSSRPSPSPPPQAPGYPLQQQPSPTPTPIGYPPSHPHHLPPRQPPLRMSSNGSMGSDGGYPVQPLPTAPGGYPVPPPHSTTPPLTTASPGGYTAAHPPTPPVSSMHSSPVISAQPPPAMPVGGGYPPTPPTPPGYYYNTPPQQAAAPWQPHPQPPPPQHPHHSPYPGQQQMQYQYSPSPHNSPYPGQPPYQPQPPPQPYPHGAQPSPGGYAQVPSPGGVPSSQGAPGNQVCQPVPSSSGGHHAEQKRSRRKCSIPDCPNRVVQGGLCISHGAKRKTCGHPGCTKNVKKAGMCSAHGPARKRCEAEGCTKVAVQGGRCIAHGAKKKVCSLDGCQKQAILGGMCKKHYDEVNGVVKVRGGRKVHRTNNAAAGSGDGGVSPPPLPAANESGSPKGHHGGGGGHQRGLSLFQDDDLMHTIINNGNDNSASSASSTTPPTENDGLHGLSI